MLPLRSAATLGVVLCLCRVMTAAGQPETFAGHLSPLPANALESRTLQGRGRATASLDKNTLTIKATFDGLNAVVTAVAVRRAVPGMRGPVQFTVPVPTGTIGTIEATVTLTPTQVDDLKRGWYYLQIDTARHPEGHLRGWLLQ